MIRARSARLRRVVAARTHAVSCARSCAANANLVATAMPCLHHTITGMASELTRRDTRDHRHAPREGALLGDARRIPATRERRVRAPQTGYTHLANPPGYRSRRRRVGHLEARLRLVLPDAAADGA